MRIINEAACVLYSKAGYSRVVFKAKPAKTKTSPEVLVHRLHGAYLTLCYALCHCVCTMKSTRNTAKRLVFAVNMGVWLTKSLKVPILQTPLICRVDLTVVHS